MASLAAVVAPLPAASAPLQDPPPPPGGSEETIALLDVRVNGWSLGLVARFYEANGRLSLPADQFDGLGFLVDEAWVTAVGDERRIWLDQVPGLQWEIDRASQVIYLTAPFERLKPRILEVAPGIPRVPARADWGAMLAYDAYGQWAKQSEAVDFARTLSVNLDARLFSPWFTATTTGFVTKSEAQPEEFIRLESWIDFDSTDNAVRLRLGDTYSAGPVWIRPFRFGGVQWMRDFSLRPDIVTTPTPEIRQDIGLPSTVDLFINGVQRYSTPVDPGTLRLTDLPIVGGSNMVSVVVTDQAGRRTQLYLPLYSSTEMLAQGMTTFNVEAGVARQNYAVDSNNYEGDFAQAAFGYGVTDQFTFSGYAAGAEDYASAAAGAAFSLGSFLFVDSALMLSDGAEGRGWAWYAGVEHIDPRFNFAASYFESDGYRDLADRFGYATFDRRATASAGLDMGRAGNLNVSWVMQREVGGAQSSVASGTWGVDLFDDRIHLSASAYAELEEDSWGAMVSLSFPLGASGDTQVYVQENWRKGEENVTSAQLRSEAFDQRLTWVLDGETGARDRGEIIADWDGRYSDIHASVATSDGATGYELGVAQSLVLMDNEIFIAGRIDDGFTVVEIDDSPGISVALENSHVGRTNARGRILITDLQSYAANAVSIDPLDLPMNASIGDTATLVAPRARAGVVTRFPVTRARSALVTLLLPDGSPPPVGASVSIVGSEAVAVVGFGGEIYLRDLAAGENRLELAWPDGRCSVAISVGAGGGLPRLGPYTCAP
ncbi:fimbria/pilus outer membrane usher protein [Brevundimonas sp.]|uniref:fimbria/pilus outer membrane usher protein n=1 Tax=Brevundimonas sp. TaxID=1871086 RepID=UPI002FCC36A7